MLCSCGGSWQLRTSLYCCRLSHRQICVCMQSELAALSLPGGNSARSRVHAFLAWRPGMCSSHAPLNRAAAAKADEAGNQTVTPGIALLLRLPIVLHIDHLLSSLRVVPRGRLRSIAGRWRAISSSSWRRVTRWGVALRGVALRRGVTLRRVALRGIAAHLLVCKVNAGQEAK